LGLVRLGQSNTELKKFTGPQTTRLYEPMCTQRTWTEVPAVLLSECYNDLRAIAATGTGDDLEWEKKIE